MQQHPPKNTQCIRHAQTRHQAALKEHTTTLAHMQKELDGLRTSEKQLRTKLRDMELDNDDLEKNERSVRGFTGARNVCQQ